MTGFLASIGYSGWILHGLLALPLLGAIPVLLAPVAAARRIALAVSLAAFLLSVGLWWALDTEPGTLQLTASVPWISAWGISYAVGI
ncbi:MAG TPA: hypothetical protein VI383_12225, partial [Gemmatimonadales bacterium]|nr:hypothetical protein [Gemmatimonadales bacterium]